MRVVSRALAGLAKKAIARVLYEHGEGFGLMVMGTWIEIDRNQKGEEVAIFYGATGALFDIERVETSLKYYVGELEKPLFEPPITVSRHPVDLWKERQREILRTIREDLLSKGTGAEDAMLEAMYRAGDFGEVREGIQYGGMHVDGVSKVVERALARFNSVEMRVEKENHRPWEGHVTVSILRTGTT